MEDIIVKSNKKKTIGMIILGIIMLIVGIFDLVIGIVEIKLAYLIIGTIGTAFFGFCLFCIIKIASNPKPLLIIGEDGINDMSTASSVGFVAWEDIESVSARRHLTQESIGITVYDIDKLMNRISPSKQRVIKLNLKFKCPPVSISLKMADMKFNEVLLIMQNKLEKNKIGGK